MITVLYTAIFMFGKLANVGDFSIVGLVTDDNFMYEWSDSEPILSSERLSQSLIRFSRA